MSNLGPVLKQSETAKKFNTTHQQLETLHDGYQRGFRTDNFVLAGRERQEVNFYKNNFEVLRHISRLGERELGREYDSLETAATRTAQQTPGTLEGGWTQVS